MKVEYLKHAMWTLLVDTQLFYLFNQDPSSIDHGGPLAGHSSSISVNPERYSTSPAIADTLSSHNVLSVNNDTNPGLIGLDVVPVSDFIDWEYMATVS